MHPMLHTAVRSVREGGRVILMYFSQLDRLEYSSKGRNDFVSQADIEAERAVLDVLTHAYPEHGVLAEESGLQEGSEYTWVIDPLDGTHSFISGKPLFGTLICCIKGIAMFNIFILLFMKCKD